MNCSRGTVVQSLTQVECENPRILGPVRTSLQKWLGYLVVIESHKPEEQRHFEENRG